ncbi:hypothetical protein [Bacteroides pyogenes]|uniref:hypothetical protein n=1 Tax=Bacteroides pyogenes TaxID=310300 RepID=UPI002FD95D1B
MKTIDYIFIICIVGFCVYGIYLGLKVRDTIRKQSIDDFNNRRKQIRTKFENNGKN